MSRSTNGWQLLCIGILLMTAATAIGAAQSTETTVNATGTPNTTPTAVTVATATTTSGVTTTLPQSPTQTVRSDQTIDDVPENATPIEVGETVTGRLPVGDQDWSKFTLESGGRIVVSVAARNQTNMSVFLYGGENLLESSFVDPGEQISLTATVDSGGQYYVFVRNEANDTAGTYAFEVSKSELTPSEPAEGIVGDTDSSDNGNRLWLWAVAFIGVIVLLGYLLFRRDSKREEAEEEQEN